MLYIGIDPGKNGGIATIDKYGMHTHNYSDMQLLYLLDMVEHSVMFPHWRRESTKIFLEDIKNSMLVGRRDARTLITQAENFGYIQGALHMAGFDINFVTPKEWKQEYSLEKKGQNYEERKKAAIKKASELWPEHDFRKNDRAKVPHDGCCEAALIAEYGRRQWERSTTNKD
jgi:hypothetical protein